VSDASLRKSLIVENSKQAVDRICAQLLKEAERNGFNKDEIFGAHLAMEEAFTNAVLHGNAADSSKKVTIDYLITPEKIDVSITDEGDGFDPESIPDPRSEENLSKSSGRGVLLMRAYMDVVEFVENGNCVHMVKRKK
jgi:serine/threonine-protein kinase RsbW